SIAPCLVSFTNDTSLGIKPAKGIQQCTVKIGIDQRTVIMLTVDFHKPLAQLTQQRNACSLIIDEDTRAPVTHLEATQDNVAIIVKTIFAEKISRRVYAGHIKYGSHLPLIRTMADQRSVAACAKRQRQRIEQDGFARTG